MLKRGKLDELVAGVREQGIDAAGLQELRLRVEGKDDYATMSLDGGYRLVYSSCSEAGVGGVGILIAPKLSDQMTEVKCVSERIIMASFKLKSEHSRLHLISAHAPIEAADDEEKDAYYDDLSTLVMGIPVHDVTVILVDANAQVGRDISSPALGRFCYHEKTNDNGKRLIEFMEEAGMKDCMSWFQHSRERMWTWEHPNAQLSDARKQLDHILINGKWMNSVKNCRAYDTVDCGSDHRIVSMSYKLSLRAPRKTTPTKRYDWASLAQHAEEFDKTITAKLAGIPTECVQYETFVEAINDTADEVLGPAPKRTQDPWVSERTLLLRETRDKAKVQRCQSEAKREEWKRLARETDEAYEEDRVAWLERRAKELEQAANEHRHRDLWEQIRTLGGAKTKLSNCTASQEEWAEYFKELLNRPPPEQSTLPEPATSDLPINVGPIEEWEIAEAVKSLKRGKSAGVDGVTAELLKDGGQTVTRTLHKFAAEVFEGVAPPDAWRNVILVFIPKKGDTTKMKNHRGIALMSIAAKVYNRVLLNRLRPHIEPLLTNAAYRKGRSARDLVHILRRLIEGADIRNLDLVITFIDFSKAFDSIDRRYMCAVLRAIGVPEKMVEAIRTLYVDTTARVRMRTGGMSDEFKFLTGVLQGDVLAPYLFIIVVDFILRQTRDSELGFVTKPRVSSRYPKEVLHDLGYADDATLLDSCAENATKHLKKVEDASAPSGLRFNVDKLQCMMSKSCADEPVLCGDSILDKVPKAKYLGAMLPYASDELWERFRKARLIFRKLFNVWKCPAPFRLKYSIFIMAVVSVLLCGIETLTLTDSMLKKFDSFQRRSMRFILGISWEDRVTTEDLEHKVKGLLGSRYVPLSTIAVQRQLRWVGHAARSNEDEPLRRYVFYDPQHGARSRGGQRKQFHQEIMRRLPNDVPASSADDLRRLASSRPQWRTIVENCRTY